MIFVAGTRLHSQTVGFIAEHCPSCRAPSVCRLIEFSQGGHLYFIPMGQGAFPLGHEARCLTCRSPFEVNALHYYAFGKKKKATLQELIPLTSPWLLPRTAKETQEEDRFRKILAVFSEHDLFVRKRRMNGGQQFDWIGGIALLAMLIVPIAMFALVASGPIPFLSKSQTLTVATVVSLAAFITGIYLIATEAKRFFRKHTLLRIHSQLDPLNAQKADWQRAISRLKRLRFPIWKSLKPELRHMQDETTPRPQAQPPTSLQALWQPPQASLKVR
jgi:hypothetical protein